MDIGLQLVIRAGSKYVENSTGPVSEATINAGNLRRHVRGFDGYKQIPGDSRKE